MLGLRQPVLHDLSELVGRHARVRRRDHFGDAFLPRGGDRLHVTLDDSFERLLRLPLWMRWRQRLHAVEGEERLEVHRLPAPERAVVVEGRDPRLRRHVLGAAALRHRLDELDDRLFDLALVP